MSCRQMKRKICAYVDDELDPASAREVGLHIRQCPVCQETVSEFRAVDTLVRELPDIDLSPNLTEEVLKKTGDFTAAVEKVHSAFRPLEGFFRFMSNLMDLWKERPSSGAHILDEFGDFPPCSIGSVYLKLLENQVRG